MTFEGDKLLHGSYTTIDIGSRAAYILLKRYLKNCAKDSLSKTHFRVWLKYRTNYLNQLKECGKLKCHYCGRSGLKEKAKNINYRVTLDHVVPLSKGGEKFNRNNIVVACFRCNAKKKDRDISSFVSASVAQRQCTPLVRERSEFNSQRRLQLEVDT